MRARIRLPRSISLLIVAALIVSACGRGEDEADPSGVLLEWMPPSQYDDGGALADNAVTEYRLYVDQEMVRRVEPDLTEFFLELPAGEWEITVSAVVDDIESRLSEPMNVVIE